MYPSDDFRSDPAFTRAYAERYRDLFTVRIISIIGIVIAAMVLMTPTWALGFAAVQFSLYGLLWRVVRQAQDHSEAPGAWARLKWRTEALTLAIAGHVAVFVILAWLAYPGLMPHLSLLIVGNLMVGALQVHVSRLSFAAAVVPPGLTVVAVMSRVGSANPTALMACVLLFVLCVIGAAYRQVITDRQTVKLFIDLSRSVDGERAAREAAEQASAAKTRFLAMISHEVRTPLNVIIGLTDVLKGRVRGRATQDLVADMGEAGDMLMRLLNGALDLSKIESGHGAAQMAPAALDRTLAAIPRVWRNRAEELGLELELDMQGPPEAWRVVTDAGRVEQTVINLLANALKMTPSGRITVRGHARLRGDLSDIMISVEDQGPGVAPDQRARVFEPFEQTDAGRAAGGAGLGLALCKANVESLGGAIGIEERPGGGALFRIRFTAPVAPVEQAPSDKPAATASARPPTDAAGPRRLRVLAAEDNAANRKLLTLVLAPLDVEVRLVENGIEALEAWRAEPFDLILMDVMMPVMDGVQALAAIRAAEAETGRDRTPTHMLTANVFADDVARYRAAGADGVLSKPLQVPALHAAIAQAGEGGPNRAAVAA